MCTAAGQPKQLENEMIKTEKDKEYEFKKETKNRKHVAAGQSLLQVVIIAILLIVVIIAIL